MSQDVKLVHATGRDFEYEVLRLYVNGDLVTSLSTSSDSPEDNSIGRMGVASFVEQVIEAVAPAQKVTFEYDEGGADNE